MEEQVETCLYSKHVMHPKHNHNEIIGEGEEVEGEVAMVEEEECKVDGKEIKVVAVVNKRYV